MTPQTELDLKNAVLDRMMSCVLLDTLRDHLEHLYYERASLPRFWPEPYVTADDAQRIMEINHWTAPTNNVLGALFRAPGWHWTGQRIQSTTPGSHGREVRCWRYEP